MHADRILPLLALAVAAILEASAGWMTLAGELAHATAVHVLAAMLAALAPWRFQPRSRRNARDLAALAGFALFVPVAGVIVLAMLTAGRLLARRGERKTPFTTVPMPALSAPRPATAAGFRAAGLRAVLLDAGQAPAVRLRSLRVLQSIPMRHAGPVLNALRDDPVEDLRLTAHVLLEREGKRVASVIHAELERLPAQADRPSRLASLRRIAEHYWELVYAGLATGDTAAYAIAQGIKYVDAALTLAPGDGALWLLRGRLLRAQDEPSGAEQSFQAALAAGMTPARGAAYLAELAFERGDLHAVREHMARIEGDGGMTLAPLVQFWQVRSRRTRLRASG